jgi:hypothetical protein
MAESDAISRITSLSAFLIAPSVSQSSGNSPPCLQPQSTFTSKAIKAGIFFSTAGIEEQSEALFADLHLKRPDRCQLNEKEKDEC